MSQPSLTEKQRQELLSDLAYFQNKVNRGLAKGYAYDCMKPYFDQLARMQEICFQCLK